MPMFPLKSCNYTYVVIYCYDSVSSQSANMLGRTPVVITSIIVVMFDASVRVIGWSVGNYGKGCVDAFGWIHLLQKTTQLFNFIEQNHKRLQHCRILNIEIYTYKMGWNEDMQLNPKYKLLTDWPADRPTITMITQIWGNKTHSYVVIQ